MSNSSGTLIAPLSSYANVFEGNPDPGTGVVPADPAIAVGPSYLITTTNGYMIYRDRSGGVEKSRATITSWWNNTNGVSITQAGDTHAVFDPGLNKYLATAIAIPYPTSTYTLLLFAVSRTSSPYNSWCWFSLGVGGSTPELDLPKVGFDSNGVDITVDTYSGNTFNYSEIISIDKTKLDSTFCTISPGGQTNYLNVPDNWGGLAFHVYPALTFGSPGNEYFTDLVCSDCYGGTNAIVNLTSLPCPNCSLLSWSIMTSLAYECRNSFPQLNSSIQVDNGDAGYFPIMRSLVYRSGHLIWSDQVDFNGYCGIRTVDIDPVSRGIRWSLGITKASTNLFDGTVMISSLGDVTAVFSETNSSMGPGIFWSRIANGVWNAPTAFHSSVYPDTACGCGRAGARWGDYFSTAPDYSDGGTWIYGQYVKDNQSHYGTYGGEVLH